MPNASTCALNAAELVVMGEDERVHGRARGRKAEAATGFEVGRDIEAGYRRSEGGRDRSLLVGSAGSAIDQASASRSHDHACGGRCDRHVVVEN